jgi:hypothetical protein
MDGVCIRYERRGRKQYEPSFQGWLAGSDLKSRGTEVFMTNIRKWVLGAAVLAGGLALGTDTAQAAQVRVYVGAGDAAYIPPSPGPGYVWVNGYYDGGYWVPGYWSYAGGVGYSYYGGDNMRYRHFDRDDYRHYDRDHDRRFYDRDDHHDRDRDHDHDQRRR